MAIKYYSIDFAYPGPYSNFPGNGEEPEGPGPHDIALSVADKAVHAAALEMGVRMLHEYSWPDGSLYKLIAVADSENVETVVVAISNRASELASADQPRRITAVGVHEHTDSKVAAKFAKAAE